MKQVLLVCLLAAVALGQTAAPVLPSISAYFSLDNGKTYVYRWAAIDPPLTGYLDSTGRPHIGLDPQSQPAPPDISFTAGPGIVLNSINSPGLLHVGISLDTSSMTMRVAPPASKGPFTDENGMGLGTGAWAADGQYFYCGVPSGDGTTFVWARVPLQTDW